MTIHAVRMALLRTDVKAMSKVIPSSLIRSPAVLASSFPP